MVVNKEPNSLIDMAVSGRNYQYLVFSYEYLLRLVYMINVEKHFQLRPYSNIPSLHKVTQNARAGKIPIEVRQLCTPPGNHTRDIGYNVVLLAKLLGTELVYR